MEQHPEYHKCDDCHRIYKTKHSLQIHGKRAHGAADDRRNFKCETCGRQYESKTAYEKHIKAHQDPGRCPHCDFTTMSSRILRTHIIQHRDNKQFCLVCEKFFLPDFYSTHFDMCKPVGRSRTPAARRSEKPLAEPTQESPPADSVPGIVECLPSGSAPVAATLEDLSEGDYQPVELPPPYPAVTQQVIESGVDVDIPMELLNACQDLDFSEHMELTGVTTKHEGDEHPIKIAVVKKNDVVHLSLEASVLGPAFQQAIVGRWHCSFDAAYISKTPQVEGPPGAVMDTVMDVGQEPPPFIVQEPLDTDPKVSTVELNESPSKVPVTDQNAGPSEVPTAEQSEVIATSPGSSTPIDAEVQAYLQEEVEGVGISLEAENRGKERTEACAGQERVDELPQTQPIKSDVASRVDSDDGGNIGNITCGDTEPEIEDMLGVKSMDKKPKENVKTKIQTRSRSKKNQDVSTIREEKSTRKQKPFSGKKHGLADEENNETKTPVKTPKRLIVKKSGIAVATKKIDCNVPDEPETGAIDRNVAKELVDNVAELSGHSVSKELGTKQKTPGRRGRKPKAKSLVKTIDGEQVKEEDLAEETPRGKKKGKRKAEDLDQDEWTPAKTTPKRQRGRPRSIKKESLNNEEYDAANRPELLTSIWDLATASLCTDISDEGTPNKPHHFNCLLCGRTFSAAKRRHVLPHMREVHTMSLEEYLTILQVTDPEERKKVIEIKKEKLSQEQRMYKAKKYNRSEDDLIKCPACITIVNGIPAYRSHVINVHRDDPDYDALALQVEKFCDERMPHSTEVMIACPFCQKERRGLQGLKTHMRLVHATEPDLPRAIKQQQVEHKALYNQFRRKQYRKYVTTKPSYPCKFCPETFAFRSSRARHMKFTCLSNPDRMQSFVCATCNKRFATHEDLVEHRQVHKDENFKWVCDMCGLMRSTRSGLYEHKRNHHNTKPPDHKCPYCDKAFYNKERCERHKLSHTNLRKYQCEICGNHYKTKAAVSKHQKSVHFNRYRYHCETCGHGMQKLQYLQSHVCGRVRRNQDPDSIINSIPKIRVPNPRAIKSEVTYTPEETIIEDEVAANYLIDLNPQGQISISVPVEATTAHDGTQYLRPQFGSKLVLDGKVTGGQPIKYEPVDSQVLEETVVSQGAPLGSSVPLTVTSMGGVRNEVMHIQQMDGSRARLQTSSGATMQTSAGQVIEQVPGSSMVPLSAGYSYQGLPTVLDYSQGASQVIVQYSDQQHSLEEQS